MIVSDSLSDENQLLNEITVLVDGRTINIGPQVQQALHLASFFSPYQLSIYLHNTRMTRRSMNYVTYSTYIVVILYFQSLHLQLTALADNTTSYFPSENIVLNCGSNTSEFVQYDGRKWIGDIASPYMPSNADINSLIAKASTTLDSIPQVPYMTARIFRSQFTYRFDITTGPKFIRLHFFPASYLGLDVSKAFLSVSSGNFTLLHNFSVSLTADYFNLAYLMKEFIVHVSGSTLELTFAPTSNASDAYAFVNGIEVVSMPLHLYVRGDDAPLPLVGYNTLVYYDNDSALETMYRLNVGGYQIPPKYDTGMFRTWDTDDAYIFGAIGVEPFNMTLPILYTPSVPAYTAPESVYHTSRASPPFENNPRIILNMNQTWFFPVDSGFHYLVRLHFCDTLEDVTKINQLVFTIFLNNQTAEKQFDPIALGGGRGIPVYHDYVVMVLGSSEAKQDLWLDLIPNPETKPQFFATILNGVEIFKLSSYDKNLAGPNPFKNNSGSAVKVPNGVPIKKPKKLPYILIGCGLGVVVLLILLCLVLYRLKVIRPKRIMSWFSLIFSTTNRIEDAKKSSFFRHFSMMEIKVATNNFDEALLIGAGGFGRVYKGSLDGGSSFVAIKRADPMSEQGVLEYETEIHLLSQLRHNNLVSLLGCCNEDGEMILVYDFMANGSLYDLLHSRPRDQQNPPLSWIQRLEICVGVTRGLHYLHTGTRHKIIHRDIKTTNILLDSNLVAKISDFGLSKASYPSLSTTNVKGSIGYLDPEYYQCHKLTEKSDLYSLGVVLLEVLSGRPAVSPGEDDENVNLAEWAMVCFEKGNKEKIVDPYLEGNIVKECFEVYVGVAMKCLAERGVERPSIGDVLQNLVLAMQLEKNAGIAQDGNIHKINDNTGLQGNSDLTPGIEFSDIIMQVGR
ncbi:hypothetical protein RIF29_16124 [Crotalaria pallida]|uniref:non-specific serine/threonine protein kinase n=1 Tax=Crotalaria pallida TaxID=3830 RepID=A0AAN9IBR7_CROPI